MEIFGVSIKGVIKPNVRVLFFPAVLLIFLLIISLVVFKNGVTKISSQLKQLKAAKNTEATLQEKVNLLQQMGGTVLSQSNLAVIALPDNNPALTMLVQLNSLAEKHGLTIIQKEVARPIGAQAGMSKAIVSVKIGGELSQLTGFIKEIRSLAPVSTLDEVQMDSRLGVLTAKAKVAVYFSKFPEKLPPLTEPVKVLTDEEELIFEEISGLVKPEFVELAPSEPAFRENPFN